MNKTSYRSIIAVVVLSAAITTAADSFLKPGDR